MAEPGTITQSRALRLLVDQSEPGKRPEMGTRTALRQWRMADVALSSVNVSIYPRTAHYALFPSSRLDVGRARYDCGLLRTLLLVYWYKERVVRISSFGYFPYSSIITFSEEVQVIWSRKWSVTTWLYAFTRYTSVLFTIWTFIPVTENNCKSDQYIIDAFELIQYLCFALFSALRVYALLNGRVLIATVVFLLNLVPFVVNFYNFVTSVVVWDIELCTSFPTLSENTILTLSLVTRISVIVGDILIIAVTWFKTFGLYKEARRLNLKAPLATMLLRDGTFYFLILLILNILQVIARNSIALQSLSIASSLQEVMTPLIICRFILDLRQVETTDSPTASENPSTHLRFVGNLGQSLQTGMEFVDDEDTSILSSEMEEFSSINPSEASQETHEAHHSGHTILAPIDLSTQSV